MQIDNSLTLSISLGALGAAFAALVGWIITAIKVGRFVGAYQLKVDTMWDFLIRRGQAAGLRSGILEQNSPLNVSQRARDAFPPLLVQQMRVFYKTLPAGIKDHDLALALERKFGEEISKTVCPPLKANMGECLIAAVILVREDIRPCDATGARGAVARP